MATAAYQLDWNLIRTFTAVVTSGSLSAAARDVSLTYPTVARHIQQLEESLQLTLFDRTSSGMSPTAAGIRLAATARDMRTHALAFETASDALRTEPGGTVRITVSEFLSQMAPSLLAPLQPDIAASGATVEIVPSNALINLLEHDADIALRHIRPTQADLVCRRVGSLGISVWAERSYLAQHAKAAGVALNAPASTMPTLQYIDGISHSRLRDGAARLGIPIEASQINYQSDCVWNQLHAARAGWGALVLPDYLGAEFEDLQQVELGAPIQSLELWVVARRDMRENSLHRTTFDQFAESITQVFGERELATG